ncbi:hypothetical protein [Xanthocytophaga agilis]|uniref:Uncharacterized protein n=1 Tax=Xanthocytophaga agilis TaxID=3048010 RepID=A0AAE3QY04_9BACT|nr:hypothetical protein [Xanthocytophaga agilis]MDJ1500076.1 hypothetical protein [Xanthocytophaga agilis]
MFWNTKSRIDYFLIPYERHIIYTKLSPEEMEKRFYDKTTAPTPSMFTHIAYTIQEDYEGEFYTNGFYMQAISRGRNQPLLVFSGKIQEYQNQTKIILTIEFQPLAKIIFYLFFFGLTFLFMAATISAIKNGGEGWKAAIGIGFINIVLVLIFKTSSSIGLSDIKKLFEAEKLPEKQNPQ